MIRFVASGLPPPRSRDIHRSVLLRAAFLFAMLGAEIFAMTQDEGLVQGRPSVSRRPGSAGRTLPAPCFSNRDTAIRNQRNPMKTNGKKISNRHKTALIKIVFPSAQPSRRCCGTATHCMQGGESRRNSNRVFLRLETSLTHSKQTTETRSNRVSDRGPSVLGAQPCTSRRRASNCVRAAKGTEFGQKRH